VIIFVHGDGAIPFDAYGYYHSMWNILAKRGIASFTWDKPGVGDSKGDWLTQNMDDRAAEVVAAFEYLNQAEQIDAEKIGLIGFSQAGWVLPRLGSESWVEYMIFVSTAINWVDQSNYLTRQRLLADGYTNEKMINAVVQQDEKLNSLIANKQSDYDSYLDYLRQSQDYRLSAEPMSKSRFEFVRKNINEDASHLLDKIEKPVLVLFGFDDLNIDIANSLAAYQRIFKDNNDAEFYFRVFGNATHSLTKSHFFNKTTPTLIDILKINFLGEDVFADGVLDSIADFADDGYRPDYGRARKIDHAQEQ